MPIPMVRSHTSPIVVRITLRVNFLVFFCEPYSRYLNNPDERPFPRTHYFHSLKPGGPAIQPEPVRAFHEKRTGGISSEELRSDAGGLAPYYDAEGATIRLNSLQHFRRVVILSSKVSPQYPQWLTSKYQRQSTS